MMRKVWCFTLIPYEVIEVYVKLSQKMSGAEVKEECVLKAREEHDLMRVHMHIHAILTVKLRL